MSPTGFFCLTTRTMWDECPNCGGSPKADGCSPIKAFDGFTYCTSECAEEAAHLADRERRRFASTWCPACGYDNHEHADDCSAARGVESPQP